MLLQHHTQLPGGVHLEYGWQMLGLLGLILAIASASVVDPRPQALYRLMNSMKQISDSNYLEIN